MPLVVKPNTVDELGRVLHEEPQGGSAGKLLYDHVRGGVVEGVVPREGRGAAAMRDRALPSSQSPTSIMQVARTPSSHP